MIRELNANQVVLVSGGSTGQSVINNTIAATYGFLTDRAVVGAAARIGLSAARGAAFGGLAGVLVGVAIGVGLEIMSRNSG